MQWGKDGGEVTADNTVDEGQEKRSSGGERGKDKGLQSGSLYKRVRGWERGGT